MNEESCVGVMDYFKEVKQSQKNGNQLVMQFNQEAFDREQAANETLSRPPKFNTTGAFDATIQSAHFQEAEETKDGVDEKK